MNQKADNPASESSPIRLRRPLYLSGYRGTGKTTVGRLVAQQLATECVDLDVAIEAAAGKTIAEIFDGGGESAFRDWETRCLRELETRPAANPAAAIVVSLGGGAILRDENRQLIADSGVCVWLKASPETIASRINMDETTAQRRPALTQLSPLEEIRAVLEQREPLYRESARLIVDTEQKSPQQVGREIVQWLCNQGIASTGT